MHLKQNTNKSSGFTLVEIIVVIAIITIMLSIITASIFQARESAREKSRVAALANIEFALTLYRDKERNYPLYPNGIEIGTGGALDASIVFYNGNIYTDPSSKGVSGSEYAYWYDSDFTCTVQHQQVIFARTMEQSKNGNFSELCTAATAGTEIAGPDSFVVVLK